MLAFQTVCVKKGSTCKIGLCLFCLAPPPVLVSGIIEKWRMSVELLILPGHLSSPSVLVGFVLFDLYFYVQCFEDRCLSFYGHCDVCSSLI